MCHLHRALFLELRFAECKGWAGFSGVPDSWEEEEEGTGLISCSVPVRGGCRFTSVLWCDGAHVAFPHLRGGLWILYVPLYFSFPLVLLALCSEWYSCLPIPSLVAGAALEAALGLGSLCQGWLQCSPACPSSPFRCLGVDGLCPRWVGMDRHQEWAGCQLVWSWMGTVTLWEDGPGRRALLWQCPPSHLPVQLLPLLPACFLSRLESHHSCTLCTRRAVACSPVNPLLLPFSGC